ncbi:MAG: hypothetical protein KBS97_00470 [Firmicutes bacterium]|nr:hypothetical protein [Candidatus Fiminaster equi]
MKTFKLILRSLISNNACIEGGRKKPWYFAVIMLFLSMIFAILPLFVQTINTNGDDAFATYTYGADVATLRFTEDLNNNGIKMYVKKAEGSESKMIVAEKDGAVVDVNYAHTVPAVDGTQVPDFLFFYRTTIPSDAELQILVGEKQETSFMFFTQNEIIVHLVNFDTKAAIKNIVCQNAPKYLNEGRSINEMLSALADPTARVNETFANWKLFIRDSYNYTRLTALWQTCLIMGGINLGITAFMGFMIWILTRGKNNPYRLFNLWDTQKMAWWAAITPSILSLAFGFLIPRFANILFPMLIGIRVMWLSMKSLRPDGSGYAESN